MSGLLTSIAVRHLRARPRQSLVSLTGIILGVAFFLAVSSLMHGSEADFIHRLIDNAPHATVSDEYREPRRQPMEQMNPDAAVEIHHVKPLTETRGIRHYDQIVTAARQDAGTQASAVLVGQGILTFAGRNTAVTLNGVTPSELDVVSNLHNYMKQGQISDLAVNRSGIIIGSELARTMSIAYGENISMASPTGQVAVFKVVGIFSTGRTDYDQRQTFADIRRVQALMNRPDRANSIIVKLPDPYAAREFAARLEAKAGYKVMSWQESWKDLMDTLHIRNIIMYSVVSAILVVASFGIYNVISTVVMEKHRDIAILKSMGFLRGDIQKIFLIQGIILGAVGSVLGLGLGSLLMSALMQVRLKPPGSTEAVYMPLSWDSYQFFMAAAFAILAAVFASYLPARKGAAVRPVDILRGAA
jgi:lipoprotein-releasing system permease protein